MARLFLSYTMNDRDVVKKIERTLIHLGHSVFVDRGEVASGTSWADTVRNAISDADMVVVITSAPRLDSDYALNIELGAAWGLGKPIVVVAQSIVGDIELPLPHARYHVVSTEGQSEDEIVAAILAKGSELAMHSAS